MENVVELIIRIQRRMRRGRVDYTHRIKVNPYAQPFVVAFIEANAANLHLTHGLKQAKNYAASKRRNVPFVFALKEHRFVEYDHFSGLNSPPPSRGLTVR